MKPNPRTCAKAPNFALPIWFYCYGGAQGHEVRGAVALHGSAHYQTTTSSMSHSESTLILFWLPFLAPDKGQDHAQFVLFPLPGTSICPESSVKSPPSVKFFTRNQNATATNLNGRTSGLSCSTDRGWVIESFFFAKACSRSSPRDTIYAEYT